ncbi:MAG: hypothetical protein ABW065_13120 [Solirubrobacterales bacterium]
MRGGRVTTGVVLVLLLGLLGAGRASACSCAPTPPKEALAEADAAIVGRLLAVEPRGPARAAYRYRVVRIYRGGGTFRRGSVATVLSGRDSAACALPTRVDRNYGLFLLGGGGRWASGLCGVISPRRLWAAARGAPARASSSERPGCG